MRSGRGKIKLNEALRVLRSGSLDQDGIIELLDEFGMDERLVQVIEPQLRDPKFNWVRDVVRAVDLLPSEEKEMDPRFSLMTSKDVMVMMMSLRLSRPEIIWTLKKNIVTDEDMATVIKNACTPELVHIVLRWRAKIVKRSDVLPIALRYVTQAEVDRACDDANDNQKFKFLT